MCVWSVCRVCVWSVYGVCVECLWSICGVCVECVWSVSFVKLLTYNFLTILIRFCIFCTFSIIRLCNVRMIV